MGKFKKFWPFLLILIPLCLFISICLLLVSLQAKEFASSNSLPDYLWSMRITRQLKKEGFRGIDVSINTIDESIKLRIIEIRVEVDIQELRAYDVIDEVHKIMVEEYSSQYFQPKLLDKVIVMLDNENNIPFGVISDFGFAWKYHNGEIPQDLYFENWEYGNDEIPGITPP